MQSSTSEPWNNAEINLQELVRSIWRKKWLILGAAVLSTVLAAAYAFTVKPVYEAKLFLIPPTQNDIANFNYGRIREYDLVPLTIKDVYSIFIRILDSESLHHDFFTNVYLPALSEEERKGSRDALYSRFSKMLVVTPPVKESGDQSAVSVQAADPDLAANWVQAYADRAGKLAKDELIKNITTESQVRARNLLQQIDLIRGTGIQLRQDSITKLREALRVAEAIGLEKPPIITGNPSVELAGSMDGQLIYMRGSKALKAEIENLEARQSDDPFVHSLRDLQAKYEFYQNLQIKPSDVWVYRQDGDVSRPDSPIKPKKTLIVVLGLILGLMTGLVIAVILFLIEKSRTTYYKPV
ncbi:LPS O-antigen chain length determinant protein WzzB [Pseudomonas sp. PB3P13]